MAYIDDILILEETAKRARHHTDGLVYLLENLRFLVHPEKTVREPTQVIECLDERTAPTRPENEEGKVGGSEDQRSTKHIHGSGSVTPIREIQLSFPGSASRPSLQQISAEGPSHSIGVGRPMLRNPMPPLSRSKRGAGVVNQPIFHVEWEESGTETARPSDRIRRVSHGPRARDTDRVTMVQAEVSLHQLSGTASSEYCCKRILLLLDSQTAVSYVNNLGGTDSGQWRGSFGCGAYRISYLLHNTYQEWKT